MKQQKIQHSQDTQRRDEPGGRPFWALVALIIVLLGIIVVFLVMRPRPGIRPGPAATYGIPTPPAPPMTDLHEKTKTLLGTVVGFKWNPHFDYNAIEVRTEQLGTLRMDFRPHTARAVMELAAVRDTVEVRYATHPSDEQVGYALVSIENIHTGKKIILNELPPPPDVPPNHSAEYFTVHHPELITDQYGGIVAIRSGHYLFHFKPGLVDDILTLMKSPELGLSAVWRDDHFGFVNVHGDKVYIVLSVTVDNKTFLVR